MEQDPLITNHEPPVIKSNSFLVSLLSFLLLISCLIAGFFAWQTQRLVKELTVYRLQPTGTPTPTPDPTADWKTYTNTNFTFKYPSDWFVGISKNDILYMNDKEIESNISKTDQVYITIDTYENKDEVEILNKRMNDTYNSNVKVVGETKYEITDLRSHPIEGYSYMIAQTTMGEFYINIGLSNSNFEEQFDSILSTFKFIEPKVSTSPLSVACTMDAKICPDGSAVGRSGPKCEFAPCPTTSP